MLQCTNTWRPLVFSLCQKSLKFRSKSNEGSISVSNIWDYLRSDYRNLPFRFWQTGSLPCFSYVRNSEKELKLLESDSLWLARFDRKFLGYSHMWSTPHVINAILGHYAHFWTFWRESFEARKQRLPLFIDDKYRWNLFISLAVFLSFRGFALLCMNISISSWPVNSLLICRCNFIFFLK